MPDDERDEQDERQDHFKAVIAELGDGQRWALIRTRDWDDFVVRLAHTIEQLPVRRRQALLMMLLAMSDGNLSPESLQAYLEDRDMDDEVELDGLIEWLRQFRPRER